MWGPGKEASLEATALCSRKLDTPGEKSQDGELQEMESKGLMPKSSVQMLCDKFELDLEDY